MNKTERDGKILVINADLVNELLSNEEALELTDKALKDFAAGVVVNPVKLHLPLYPDTEGYINSMPTYHTVTKDCGMKFVSVFRDNLKNYGVPCTMGTVILTDWQTGMPYAIVDGTNVTNARTGAAAGLKLKYFTKPQDHILTIIGAGAQGYSGFIMAMTATGGKKFDEIRVNDVRPETIDNFIAKAKVAFPDANYVPYTDNNEAVKGTDAIIIAAPAPFSITERIDLDEGVTVAIIHDLMTVKAVSKFDKFYSDFPECAMERFNQSLRNASARTGEDYGQLSLDMFTDIVGKAMAAEHPRTNDKDRILCLDVGIGIEDVSVARYVYRKAVEQDKGVVLDFQCF